MLLKTALVLLLAAQTVTAQTAASRPSRQEEETAREVAELLARLEGDIPGRERLAVAVQLSRLGDAATVPLIDGFRSASAEARPFILLALERHPTDEVKAMLLAELKEKEGDCPLDVISTLGRLKVGEATPILLDLYAQEEDEAGRRTFLATLAQLRDMRALDVLAEASLSTDRVERLTGISGLQKLAALAAKGRLSEEDREEMRLRLAGLLANENLPARTRSGVITACGMTCDEGFADLVARFVNHGSRDTRRRAIQALGRMKAGDHAWQITQALEDEETSVRINAIEALEKIGDEEPLPDLIALLSDPEALVRKRALRALRSITGQRLSMNRDQWDRWYDTRYLAADDWE